jgi:antitoxin component YwqK of YwqJK toxin-antitoxin module
MKQLITLITCITLSLQLVAQGGESLNQVDAQGEKHGVWEVRYDNEDQQLRYRGEFDHGTPIGTFFYYYESGEKSSEVTYLGDGLADARFFHKNGTIMGQGKYKDQEKTGEWRFFDNHTVLSSVEPYKTGKLDGVVRVYHLNGQVAAEVPYVEGRKNGPFKEYNPNGKVLIEGTYADGTFDGEYKQYYDDGSKYMTGYYKAAVKDSIWKYYNDDGYIMYQEVYDVGELIKRRFEEGYTPEKIKVELEESDIINEDQLIEEFMNGAPPRR